jgi:hypothetical protein
VPAASVGQSVKVARRSNRLSKQPLTASVRRCASSVLLQIKPCDSVLCMATCRLGSMQPMWASVRSQTVDRPSRPSGYLIVEALRLLPPALGPNLSWRLRLFLDMPLKDLTPNKTSHCLSFQTDRYGRQANVPRFQHS